MVAYLGPDFGNVFDPPWRLCPWGAIALYRGMDTGLQRTARLPDRGIARRHPRTRKHFRMDRSCYRPCSGHADTQFAVNDDCRDRSRLGFTCNFVIVETPIPAVNCLNLKLVVRRNNCQGWQWKGCFG